MKWSYSECPDQNQINAPHPTTAAQTVCVCVCVRAFLRCGANEYRLIHHALTDTPPIVCLIVVIIINHNYRATLKLPYNDIQERLCKTMVIY